jgi:hypothetical protein
MLFNYAVCKSKLKLKLKFKLYQCNELLLHYVLTLRHLESKITL